MTPARRRRIDALPVPCSTLLGVVLSLFFSQRAGPPFLLFALVPFAVVARSGAPNAGRPSLTPNGSATPRERYGTTFIGTR
ncbi:hypothetical protein ACFQJD_10060 [Haloplanus sp. GCM10025708]|uniref:hypothetical protein n=1 Tax=Haloferacaceae TaxID=1644056 RepID=UPI0036140976